MTPEQARMLTPLTNKHREEWVGLSVASPVFPPGIPKMEVVGAGANVGDPGSDTDFVILKTMSGDAVAMVSADLLYVAPVGWLNDRPLHIGDRVALNPRRPMGEGQPADYIDYINYTGRVVGRVGPASSGETTAVRVAFPYRDVIGDGNVVVCEIGELVWPEDVKRAPASGWINIYPNVTEIGDRSQIALTSGAVYPDVETADNYAGPTRVACIRVEFPAP